LDERIAKVSGWSLKWPFRHLGSVTEVDVDDDDNKFVVVTCSIDGAMGGRSLKVMFSCSLDPVSKSCCLDITFDLSGASTYRFCTRSGPGLGVIRLILIGVLFRFDNAP
jgi:hypothetical protein